MDSMTVKSTMEMSMAALPETPASPPRTAFGILEKGEEDTFPNLHKFLIGPGSKCRAEIDVVKFSALGIPSPVLDVHRSPESMAKALQMAQATSGTARTAELFIVEDLDLELIRHFLDSRVTPANRISFLAFLDDYLFDEPTFNFTDVRYHIAPMPSVLAGEQHVTFSYNNLREFDRKFKLTYQTVQNAAVASGKWRSKQSYGPVVPVQRTNSHGTESAFPPLAVSRSRASVWFDGDHESSWRTGILLVDRYSQFPGLPGSLQEPYFIIAGKQYSGSHFESTRRALTHCMGRNQNLTDAGVPPPFTVLQDLYRLVWFEWMRIDAYFTRDLNSIEWVLQGGDASQEHDAETFKSALRSLHFIRRRLNRYRALIRAQRATCTLKGRTLWNTPANASPEQARVADGLARDLEGDFGQIEQLMTQSFDRLEQSIRHISGETTIKEAERTNEQNRILLLLALAGTFFLPISAIAAIFSMTGDWAPQQENFGLFWAVCISISVLLMVLLVVVIRWSSIMRLVRRLRQRGDGYQRMVAGTQQVV